MSMFPKKRHGPELKCGGPSLCQDCREEAFESSWKERAREAIKGVQEGQHAWFKFKLDSFDSCAKCGIVRRRDDKNKPCPGKVKVELREE